MAEGKKEEEYEALIPGIHGPATQCAAGSAKLLCWRAGVNRAGTEGIDKHQASLWHSAHACMSAVLKEGRV